MILFEVCSAFGTTGLLNGVVTFPYTDDVNRTHQPYNFNAGIPQAEAGRPVPLRKRAYYYRMTGLPGTLFPQQ